MLPYHRQCSKCLFTWFNFAHKHQLVLQSTSSCSNYLNRIHRLKQARLFDEFSWWFPSKNAYLNIAYKSTCSCSKAPARAPKHQLVLQSTSSCSKAPARAPKHQLVLLGFNLRWTSIRIKKGHNLSHQKFIMCFEIWVKRNWFLKAVKSAKARARDPKHQFVLSFFFFRSVKNAKAQPLAPKQKLVHFTRLPSNLFLD